MIKALRRDVGVVSTVGDLMPEELAFGEKPIYPRCGHDAGLRGSG